MQSLIALGGGVVGDVTGFLASIYMRGVGCDPDSDDRAGPGGCSGRRQDRGESAVGKNLLGTFHQPRAVLVDPGVLSDAAVACNSMPACTKR